MILRITIESLRGASYVDRMNGPEPEIDYRQGIYIRRGDGIIEFWPAHGTCGPSEFDPNDFPHLHITFVPVPRKEHDA